MGMIRLFDTVNRHHMGEPDFVVLAKTSDETILEPRGVVRLFYIMKPELSSEV